jgi:DNA-binding transcriptional LysR family regulator
MARVDQFTGLTAFLAVAKHASFRAAAAELGITRAAVSQAIQTLEHRVGLPLFQRTTRSVALTEAGEQFLATVQPACVQIGRAIEHIAGQRSSPIGHLRLGVPRIAIELVIAPVLTEFRRAFPGITVELDIDDASVDLTARRCDAGIRIGEFIQRDMVAVKLTSDFQWMVLGAPEYFARRGRPLVPKDLMQHECIRYRFPTAATVYRWEFQDQGAEFTLDPPGGVTVNDHLSMVEFARRGLGLAYTADLVAADALRSGELLPVLQTYLPLKQGLFLYFPSNAQTQPKLRTFIDVARTVLAATRRMRASPRSS